MVAILTVSELADETEKNRICFNQMIYHCHHKRHKTILLVAG